eukprot:787356-Rhodomonas_salina.2
MVLHVRYAESGTDTGHIGAVRFSEAKSGTDAAYAATRRCEEVVSVFKACKNFSLKRLLVPSSPLCTYGPAMHLCARYAKSGTDVSYAATRRRRFFFSGSIRPIILRRVRY